ncbi:hypothetical protein QBC47DRAFT_390941 [Echria macrotheca]|uniref:Inhibitor of growth protein N-terminal histone-binding domain-containing protein n=1 Tax=Echria macrotheca TaxID=438768 RepID=A0AAJ0F835_9PEZI|nr:hypothetical protein QBC47DRAFT_390941 [Echria macrotheca]
MAADEAARPDVDEAVSPRQNAPPIQQAIRNVTVGASLGTLDLRADPDAQATVNDFLDFTEYLPADMIRSLTLIRKLDQTYVDSSAKVNDLTTTWGQLPTIPPAERPGAVELRAQISESLQHALNSRTYAYAEAVRMYENISRYLNRGKTIQSKLAVMLQNFPPPEEQKSPVATSKSPQLSRVTKLPQRADGQKVRRPRIPRITVPGEVLAPYELNYEMYTSGSESSSSEEEDDNDDLQPTGRATPGPNRSRGVKGSSRPPKAGKIPKSRTSVPPPAVPGGIISTSAALAQHKPPPENAAIGSADAPWGQLTEYELARLRKRMKKNSAWTPSDTMVARELSNLGRGVEAFKAAKAKAEEEGRPFEGQMPVPVVDPETGDERMPLGALTMDALATDERNLSNRGMRLNEAKKLKRKMLATMAAEEAEESAKRMQNIAQTLFTSTPSSQPLQDQGNSASNKAKPPKKRKRDSVSEADAEKPRAADAPTPRPQIKRTKTETPVPPPQISQMASQQSQEMAIPPSQRAGAAPILHSTTPIPLPAHGQDYSITAKSAASVASATSPTPSSSAGQPIGGPVVPPVKLPVSETPIPPPVHSPKKSTTPILPPVRETRKSQAARTQDQPKETPVAPVPKPVSRTSSPLPSLSPQTDPDMQLPPFSSVAPASGGTAAASAARRPGSRGKASSQEPQPSLAADRPRRASTARNTPAPERSEAARPSSRRSRRPAPGIISQTVSGSKSAVTKRTAAPKKKSARASGNKLGKDSKTGGADGPGGGAGDTFEVEVDDEGNVIDPNEPRYCLCNRVSFGMMIQCELANDVSNLVYSQWSAADRVTTQNCKGEWFHLECVGLTDVPPRTTKWYCPDCRIALKIGEKGEVSARGVKA